MEGRAVRGRASLSAGDQKELNDEWRPVAPSFPDTGEWLGYVDDEDDDYLVADLPNRADRVKAYIRSLLEAEAAAGTLFLLLPAPVALGAINYFLTPREPTAWALVLLGALIAPIMFLQRARSSKLALATVLFIAGFSAAKWRTDALDTIVVPRVVVGTVVGTVRWTEQRADGSVRYTLGVERFDGRIETHPERIRVVARRGEPIAPGRRISARVRLMPPSGPVVPGGYDFAFYAWFDGRGAIGTMLGAPTVLGEGDRTLAVETARWRFAIAERINEGISAEAAPLVRALVIGDRSGIPEDVAEDLRISGLAHILAISGLHMMLVTGLVFVTLRKVCAVVSADSVRFPVKKYAAIGAMMFAVVYLLLSGMNVSTQRAFLMVGVMLGAVLFDRRAITLRNVAVAAIVILLWQPEAIFAPGFQMSFAATAGLTSAYAVVQRWRERRSKEPGGDGWLRSAAVWIGGLSFTSLVAGFATSPFAAYHFHRVALLSLVANLIAMPVVTFAVMPLAVVSVLAMPLGLDTLVLPLLGYAVEFVTYVSAEVAAYDMVVLTGLVRPGVFALWVLGFCTLVLFRTELRLLGLLFIAAAVIWPGASDPVAVVNEDGRNMTVLDDGGLTHSAGRPESFVNKIVAESFPRTAEPERFRCDRLGCVAVSRGVTYAVSKDRRSLVDDCERADIVVLGRGGQCPNGAKARTISRTELRQRGSLIVHRSSDGTIEKVHAYGRYPRPWTQHRFRQ